MSTMVANPNHIGCHTLGESEEFFAGTQTLEKDLIRICAEEILGGDTEMQDGYVASGGTEANIQATWIYRNYFLNECSAKREEIAIFCSTDTHYAIHKGADLLCLDVFSLNIEMKTRNVTAETLKNTLEKAKTEGKKHFIVFVNMATTMFGSVDNVNLFTSILNDCGVSFKIHVDGAFGGFIYPFTAKDNLLTFKNPHITSFTLDAHKLAQAPCGIGIFLIRKNYISHVFTKEAQYVHGQDITLVGSRSGANAIAVWMILATYGPHGWREKINTLIHRTNWLCEALTKTKSHLLQASTFKHCHHACPSNFKKTGRRISSGFGQ
ncbi:MAG: pyridoxal-dependent decarboxylase [Flavobacteriales bacterium]